MLNILYVPLISFLSLFLIKRINAKVPFFPKNLFCLLYGYHAFFSVVYLALAERTNADALAYYTSKSLHFGVGTSFIHMLTSILSEYFYMPMLSAFWVYHTLGFFGFVFLSFL